MSVSEQADLIDDVVWSKLSRFWTDGYSPDNKEALTAVYDAYLRALDAEYVRLFEIRKSNSIVTCPVFTQRRWLRLDLNKYAEVKAWLQFLRGGLFAMEETLPNELNCTQLTTRHARHWHLSFPFTVPTGEPDERGILDLGFPIAAVEVYKLLEEPSAGILYGARQNPGVDYTIDNTKLRLLAAKANEKYELVVAFDFSSDSYSGLRPAVASASTFISSSVIPAPTAMYTGLPVHVLIVRHPSYYGSTGLQCTNRADFSTTKLLVPNCVYDQSGDRVLLPDGVEVQAGDLAFIYGLEPGDFDATHVHAHTSSIFDATGETLSSFTPDVQIPLGLFGLLEFRLFVNGRLLAPREYAYNYASNTVTLSTPIQLTSRVLIDILYNDEQRSTELATFHTHSVCYKGSVDVPTFWATFDDAGTFDDGGAFDDTQEVDEVILPHVRLDAGQTDVYCDGVLLQPYTQYTVVNTPDEARVNFLLSVAKKNILVTSRQPTAMFVYGTDDILAGAFSPVALDNALADLQNLVKKFETTFGRKISDLAMLLEAAHIAAAGGNPLFALFHDEFREFSADGISLDAAGQFVSAQQARILESANTTLLSIPFLTDHVIHPTVRLEESKEYGLVDGNVYSARDLLAPRGEGDLEPGVWWCPLVILDERLLAKNFGSIVNDVRTSSTAYKNSLQANLALRFSGAAISSLAMSAAIIAGSPLFSRDSVIKAVDDRTVGYVVTVSNPETGQSAVFDFAADAALPAPNAPIATGQSILGTLVVDTLLQQLVDWSPGKLVIAADLVGVREGDSVRLEVMDGLDKTALSLTVASVVKSVILGAVETTLLFDWQPQYTVTTACRLRIFRNSGAPYSGFDGFVTSIAPRVVKVVSTEFEEFEVKTAEWHIGDTVFAGQPVLPGLATAYDHQSKPNWHWDTLPSEPTLVVRTGTMRAGSLATAVLDDTAEPMPARGTKCKFEDKVYTVTGTTGTTAYLTPGWTGADTVGTFTFEVEAADKFFDLVPENTRSTSPSFAQRAFAETIHADVSTFPQRGRVAIYFTSSGGWAEVEYNGRTDTALQGCIWRTDGTERLKTTDLIYPVASYTERVVNPAFTELVARRAQFKRTRKPVTVTTLNADALYDKLKASAAVVELNGAGSTRVLTDLLADVTPAGSSLLVLNRHSLADRITISASSRNTESTIELDMITRIIDDGWVAQLPTYSAGVIVLFTNGGCTTSKTVYLPPAVVDTRLGFLIDAAHELTITLAPGSTDTIQRALQTGILSVNSDEVGAMLWFVCGKDGEWTIEPGQVGFNEET